MEKDKIPTKDDHPFSGLGGYISHHKNPKANIAVFEAHCLVAKKIMSLNEARKFYNSAEKRDREEKCATQCAHQCFMN